MMTKQERAARTRHALIQSAAEAFDRHGYTQAKLSTISAGAGVSLGALHFHFENKAALAQAVESASARALRRAARTVHQEMSNPLQTLADVSHVLAHLLRWDVVVRAGFQLSCDDTRRTTLNLRQEWQGCVQQLLDRAADDGTLSHGVTQQAVATTIVAATTGFEELARDNREWLSRSSLTAFWQVLLPRLAAPDVLGPLEPAGTESVIEKVTLLGETPRPRSMVRRGSRACA